MNPPRHAGRLSAAGSLSSSAGTHGGHGRRRGGWLKGFRRIGARFEKLAVNFHGMLQLAMIRRYLRLLF